VDRAAKITPAELELEPVVRVSPDTPLHEAARLLAAGDVDTVLVDTVPPTEITEADVVRAVAFGVPASSPVVDAVHERALFVGRDVPVADIVALMLHARRHGVVIIDDHGVVLGMLRLPVAVAVLLEGPPWLGALRVALGIEDVR
jgi:CBS domain-containing protein